MNLLELLRNDGRCANMLKNGSVKLLLPDDSGFTYSKAGFLYRQRKSRGTKDSSYYQGLWYSFNISPRTEAGYKPLTPEQAFKKISLYRTKPQGQEPV